MKIVITVASYYPKLDGVQYITQYMAEGLRKLGHEIVVITGKDSEINTEIVNGVLIKRLNIKSKFTRYYGNKVELKNVVLSECEDADALIVVCLQNPFGDWILEILKEIKCKKILYMHGMNDFKFRLNDFFSIKKLILKSFRNLRWHSLYNMKDEINSFNSVIHLHKKDYSYEYFKNNYSSKNFIIGNAVDNLFFEDINKKENIVLNVGSYNKRKNQIKALKIFYKSNHEDFKIVFIGNQNKDYYNKLLKLNTRLSKKYKKNSANIYFDLSRETTIEYIKKSKIYFSTSNWEAFPVTICEALSSQSVFISTNVGIVKYIKGGVIANSSKKLQSSLSKLIEDNNYYQRLLDDGMSFSIANFKQEEKVRELEKILMEINIE